MKCYNILHEFVLTTGAVFGAAMPIAMTALTGMGLYGMVKNVFQNSFNSRLTKNMMYEIYKCGNDRQKAIQVINKYCGSLSQTITKNLQSLKKVDIQKIQRCQQFLNVNFRIPIIKIISNQNDPNWNKNCIDYIKKQSKKISRSNALKTAVMGTAMAFGATAGALQVGSSFGVGAANAALNSTAFGTAGTVFGSAMLVQQAIGFLKLFNGQAHIQAMYKELQNCPDNDRQQAVKIVEKYCFNIINEINGKVSKLKLKINPEQELRNQFLIPLQRMIENINDPYWKTHVLDYIQANRLQTIVQQVCNIITMSLMGSYTSRISSMKRLIGRG